MNVATLLRRAPAVTLAAEGPAQVAARRLSPRLFWHRLALGLTLLFLVLPVAFLLATSFKSMDEIRLGHLFAWPAAPDEPLSATAAPDGYHLRRWTQDGFRLAEEDLRLRGGGELLGTRQSGDTPFRVASLEQIQNLLPMAHDDARLLMERDGGLTGERGEAARLLLYLFERDWGVQLLRGG